MNKTVSNRGRRPRVWIVDDSALEVEAVRRALAREFDTETFTDGSAVLERATTSALPDVLVLDWMMPGVSGIEVCRFLRARQELLPVLLLTVNHDTEHLIEGLGAGANDFVAKPFSAPELKARVRALHRMRQMQERVEESERERAEGQRLRAEHAEERARLSELFLGVLGHDLRSPANAIAMTARAIETQTGDEELRARARAIESCSRRMLEMIGALLDVTRTRLGGGIPLHPRRDRLSRVCRQVVDELMVVHPGRSIVVEIDEAADELELDFERMAQVVSNLVSNALIHGDGDSPVRVEAARVGGETQLRVQNRGRAIAAELVGRLFDPFRRGTTTSERDNKLGLGLGLYIAQQIVAAHGGSISVASTDVTTFTVHLPPRVAPADLASHARS